MITKKTKQRIPHTNKELQGYIIYPALFPKLYPTHKHDGAFLENLGRAVGTFGFLEGILGKAIFTLTGTRPFKESEIENAFELWILKLERALTNPLGGLIDSFKKAAQDHPNIVMPNLEELIKELRRVSAIRNIICHSSWQEPCPNGASLPNFFPIKKRTASKT